MKQHEIEEGILAADIICQAGDICGADKKALVNGITVRGPSKELLEKAKAVMESKDSGDNLEEKIRVFTEKLVNRK